MAKPLIILTDGGDHDDFKAIAYVCWWLDQNPGEYDLVGVVLDKRVLSNHNKVAASLWHFGRRAIALGKNKVGYTDADGLDATNRYPRAAVNLAGYEDSTAMLRRLLAGAAEPVRILSIGRTDTLALLTGSTADGHSSLSGPDLIAAKVDRLVMMGGQYPSGAENNLTADGPATVAFIGAWPAAAPIYFVGYEVGDTFATPFASIAALPIDSPTRAFTHASAATKEWDGAAAMAALEPDSAGWYTWVRGTNAINPTTYANTFTPDAGGPHYYAVMARPSSEFQAHFAVGACYYVAQTYGAVVDRWDFDEGAGSTTTSLNGATAPLAGTASLSTTPGKLTCVRTGPGYALAAVGDPMRFFPRRSRTYITAFTTGTAMGVENILWGGDRDAGSAGWWRASVGTTNKIQCTAGGGANLAGGTLAASTTYHVVVAVDGVAGTWSIYLDGALVSGPVSVASSNCMGLAGNWKFGGGAGAGDATRHLTGAIDFWEVREGTASDAEAAALASAYFNPAPATTPGRLLCYGPGRSGLVSVS